MADENTIREKMASFPRESSSVDSIIEMWETVITRLGESTSPGTYEQPNSPFNLIAAIELARVPWKQTLIQTGYIEVKENERLLNVAMGAYLIAYGFVKAFTDKQDWHPPLPKEEQNPFTGFQSLSQWGYETVKQNPTYNGKSKHFRKKTPPLDDDYTSVDWEGELYLFTRRQSQCIKNLMRNFYNGNNPIHRDRVMRDCDSNSEYLSDLFKGHPAWNKMITSPKKGWYQLSTDPTKK
ncbi:hypothetical protein ACFL6U_09180 [Planctomycetota bacterium]